MPWEFDKERPIYVQLVEFIKWKIIIGELSKGSRLKSVRELAQEAGVNPNTMQRALQKLEEEQLLYSQRTSGRFVTEDENLIQAIRKEFAEEKVQTFIQSMVQLGYEKKELIDFIKHYLEG